MLALLLLCMLLSNHCIAEIQPLSLSVSHPTPPYLNNESVNLKSQISKKAWHLILIFMIFLTCSTFLIFPTYLSFPTSFNLDRPFDSIKVRHLMSVCPDFPIMLSIPEILKILDIPTISEILIIIKINSSLWLWKFMTLGVYQSWHSWHFHYAWNLYQHSNLLELMVSKTYDTWCLSVMIFLIFSTLLTFPPFQKYPS